MQAKDSIFWTMVAALGVALLAGALAAGAAITPYDFTGTWTGSAIQGGKKPETFPLTATFTAGASPNTFTGPVYIQIPEGLLQCAALGKLKAHLKAKIRFTQCSDGHPVRLHGRVDPVTQTLAGRFVRVDGHSTQHGTFTLTKAP